MAAIESDIIFVHCADVARFMPDDKNQSAKYNMISIRDNIEHFDDSLDFFKLVYEFPVFFAVFPGKFFDSPGISEILYLHKAALL